MILLWFISNQFSRIKRLLNPSPITHFIPMNQQPLGLRTFSIPGYLSHLVADNVKGKCGLYAFFICPLYLEIVCNIYLWENKVPFRRNTHSCKSFLNYYYFTIMMNLSLHEAAATSGKPPTQFAAECWFDDACILDMDYFVKTLTGIKAKGVHPDLIGSIIAHYASKWLPDLSGDDAEKSLTNSKDSPESVTASWMKKRFCVETLVGILPPEKDSVPCNFLLRLLRVANMVGVEPTYRAELEKRISWQLDQASFKELLIPAFSHTCGTLLDVELVLRLVKRFDNMDEASKSGAALVKVAKLVDCYLAEAAVDANLTLSELVALAGALPSHARATDDGLYRAIDTYIKAHPWVSKEGRKILCRLIDSRKLSPEASIHAAQNERLPVRAIIQVLFSEQAKLNRPVDWSGSFSGTRSPNNGIEPSGRCPSKREVTVHQTEIRKLREDVVKLQNRCNALETQLERVVEKKGIFRWRKLRFPLLKPRSITDGILGSEEEGELGHGQRTPIDVKTKLKQGRTPPKWRASMS